MSAQLVGWFTPPVLPVRDGLYLVRTFSVFGPSECWHACRWHGASATWYAAGTSGSRYEDSIGAMKPNAHKFQWCGLSEQSAPASGALHDPATTVNPAREVAEPNGQDNPVCALSSQGSGHAATDGGEQ